MQLSVVLPTYNPKLSYIQQVLAALKAQTLDKANWELIIVDNNSTNQVLSQLDLSQYSNGYIVEEKKQGLTFSRICGFKHAKGEYIVMVDDDNILSASYLESVVKHFNSNPLVGALGGKIDALFPEGEPEGWTKQFWGMLAIKDLGTNHLISDRNLLAGYPASAPVGAGMAVRSKLLTSYIQSVLQEGATITDRQGGSLASGGDNEINIQVLQQNYSVAYFSDLHLKHIIPSERLTENYLARLNFESSKSWIQLLLKYNISPWRRISKRTIFLRKIKAYFTYKAWKTKVSYIQWQGACGMFEALGRA